VWNLLGRYPVVSAPVGIGPNGVPIGMQIVANTFDDTSPRIGWLPRMPASRRPCSPVAYSLISAKMRAQSVRARSSDAEVGEV